MPLFAVLVLMRSAPLLLHYSFQHSVGNLLDIQLL